MGILLVILTFSGCGSSPTAEPTGDPIAAAASPESVVDPSQQALGEVRAACVLMGYGRSGPFVTAEFMGDYMTALDAAAAHGNKAAQLEPRWTQFAGNIGAWRSAITVARATRQMVSTPTEALGRDCGIAAA